MFTDIKELVDAETSSLTSAFQGEAAGAMIGMGKQSNEDTLHLKVKFVFQLN